MAREGALWIGQLEPYMDETFIQRALLAMGQTDVISVKVIKNKITGEAANYGFINFENDAAARMAMHKLNGKIIPNSQPPVRFKLNHNSTRLLPGEKDYSIWVGDLSPDVDDLLLYRFFASRYESIKSAKVVLDSSGFSKGYGFIRFSREDEQKSALINMIGMTGLGSKPIKVSLAMAKSKTGGDSGSVADPTAVASAVGEMDYTQYWQYWSQYAAWNQYSQQYYDPAAYYATDGSTSAGSASASALDIPLPPSSATPAPQQPDTVNHTPAMDYATLNALYMEQSGEFWDALMESRSCFLDHPEHILS